MTWYWGSIRRSTEANGSRIGTGWSLVLVLVLFLAACGTTTAPDDVAGLGKSERSLDVPSATVPLATGDNGSATAGNVDRSTFDPQTSQDPSARAEGDHAQERKRGKAPIGAGVPGVTDGEIWVGMVDADLAVGTAVIGSVTGGSPTAQGSTKDIGEAVAARINAQGGIAGRELKIAWVRQDSPQMATREGRRRESQKYCSAWTEDRSVFAILGPALVDEVLLDCARRANAVISPYPAGLLADEQMYEQNKNLVYFLNRMLTERRDRALVQNLVRRGVLNRQSRVGIMVESGPATERGVANGMEPELSANGIDVVAKTVYPDWIDSPWNTYALQFMERGVTHVLFTGSTTIGAGFATLFMHRAAENQLWRPTWGIATDNWPDSLEDTSPPAQLRNTFAMGWSPPDDVGAWDDTETRRTCEEMTRGVTSDQQYASWYCDPLLFLRAALDRAPEISPKGLNSAMDMLGTHYQAMSAIGGQTRFSASRHDGVAVQRDLAFDGSAFRYVSDVRPIP